MVKPVVTPVQLLLYNCTRYLRRLLGVHAVLRTLRTRVGAARPPTAAMPSCLPPLIQPPEGAFHLGACMTCERRATTVCSECRAVCFCSTACQRKDYECGDPSSHVNLCAQWKLQSMRDVSVQLTSAPDWQATCVQHGGRMGDRCALLRRIGCHFGAYKLCCECTSDDATWITFYADGGGHTRTPSSQPRSKDIRLPITCQRSKMTCWSDYYAARGLDEALPVSLFLNFPMTLYHILDILGLTSQDLTRAIRVHYLGAEVREWILAQVGLYRELAILLPSSTIEVEMVGPGADGTTGKTFVSKSSQGGSVTVRFHEAVWDERFVARHGQPDVAVALNAGLGAYMEWSMALGTIMTRKIPFVFSDYTENGIELSRPIIAAMGGAFSMPITLNPFREPLRWPQLNAEGGSWAGPWMTNGFLCAVNTPPLQTGAPGPPTLIGRRVLLSGLQGRQDLNGKVGQAAGYDGAGGRYVVMIDSGESVRVKATNLALAAVEDVVDCD